MPGHCSGAASASGPSWLRMFPSWPSRMPNRSRNSAEHELVVQFAGLGRVHPVGQFADQRQVRPLQRRQGLLARGPDVRELVRPAGQERPPPRRPVSWFAACGLQQRRSAPVGAPTSCRNSCGTRRDRLRSRRHVGERDRRWRHDVEQARSLVCPKVGVSAEIIQAPPSREKGVGRESGEVLPVSDASKKRSPSKRASRPGDGRLTQGKEYLRRWRAGWLGESAHPAAVVFGGTPPTKCRGSGGNRST